MLGKLIKHEWKATRRVLIPMNLAILLITVFGCVLGCSGLFARKSAAPLAILLLMAYCLSLVAFETVSMVYLLIHFYRNLYTKEGYLMFTLPVTPMQLLHSKLLVGFLWYCLTILLTVASFAALGFCFGYQASKGNFRELTDFLSGSLTLSFQNMFGCTPAQFLALFILLLLIGCFTSITMGYASIVLGQLVEKYKAASAVGFYIAGNIIMQTILSLITAVVSLTYYPDAFSSKAAAFPQISMFQLFSVSILVSLGFGLLCYVITVILMRRGVNLT